MRPKMKHLTAALLVLLCCGHTLSDPDNVGPEQRDSSVEYDFEKNANKFKNVEAVNNFMVHYKKGLLSKDKQFSLRDPDIKAETISIIDLLYSVVDHDTLDKLILWLYGKMNLEQLAYIATIADLHIKFDWVQRTDTIPSVWYENYPNYFIPSRIIDELKREISEGRYNSSNPRWIVPDVSDPTAYFREDPDLARMFYNWNIYFPAWMNSANLPSRDRPGLLPHDFHQDLDWERRGELFYHFHKQLSSAYYLRSGAAKSDYQTLWKEPIKDGYRTELVNNAGQPFSSRIPNHPPVDNEHYKKLMDIEDKMSDILWNEGVYVNETFFLPFNGSDESVMPSILANLVYQTADSVNASRYGSFYEAGINYLASLGSEPGKDGGGLIGHPLTALRDPAFYVLLDHINLIIDDYQTQIRTRYTKEDVVDEDILLNSMESSRLETFFEPLNVDIGRIVPENKEENVHILKWLRLNHEPFVIKFNVTNLSRAKKEGLISVYLLNDIFNTSLDREFAQPIDSFKAVVEPGDNMVERNMSHSMIFAATRDKSLTQQCGIPMTLMLPKGTDEGLRMTLFAIITPYVAVADPPEHPEYPQRSPLCGNLIYNYGRTFGFPLDRGMPEHADRKYTAYCNATIYHKRNTFPGGITV